MPKSLEEYKCIFNNIHNYKYDYSLIKNDILKTLDIIDVLCIEHGIFKQKVAEHLKYGCKKCGNIRQSKKLKIPQETIDNTLKNRQLIRVSPYIGTNIKINWKCVKCNYIWLATPHAVKQGRGCPRCALANNKLNNEYIDKFLLDNNLTVIRLENYVNNNTKITFKCLLCDNIYKCLPKNLFHYKSGCRKCAIKKRKISNNEIDIFLLNSSIVRIDSYIKSKTKIKWKCNICKCEFFNIFSEIKKKIKLKLDPCPNCSPVNQNEFLIGKILKEENIPYIYQFIIKDNDKKYIVDYYLLGFKCIIEYNGRQHYEPIKYGNMTSDDSMIRLHQQRSRDSSLRKYAKDKNINLIEIDGRKYKKFKLLNLIESIIKTIK